MSRLIDADVLKAEIHKDWDDVLVWDESGETTAEEFERLVDDQPTVEPKLYGYDIKHLAMIATVMEKEGVTASKVVETLNNIGGLVGMILEEMTEQLTRTVAEE